MFRRRFPDGYLYCIRQSAVSSHSALQPPAAAKASGAANPPNEPKGGVSMRTLILSCNTGAGHNSCARAIQEVYQSRGETCDVIDALLFISKRASKFISNWHTRIYLHAPKFFSAGYEKAEEKDDKKAARQKDC